MRRAVRHLLLGAWAVATLQSAQAQAQSAAQPPRSWATCAACHAAQGGAAIGPPLAGVFGRKAGTAPGFGYSRAMQGAGVTWDAASLAAFIADPQQAVPGNRMPFPGLDDAAEVEALVRYLKTLH